MNARFTLLAAMLLVWAGGASAAPARAPEVASRLARGTERLASADPVQRRHGLADLEEAARLAPDDLDVLLALGGANLRLGHLSRAASAFERAALRAPDDARPYAGAAETHRRAWIHDMDSLTFARSLEAWRHALERDPADGRAWLRLAPMLYEAGDLRAAAAAAEQAYANADDRARAELVVAYVEYRAGHLERADRRFEALVPRLDEPMRQRLTSLHPLLTELDAESYDELVGPERLAYEDAYWKQHDPDPTTPVLESRLEFRARIAHLLALLEVEGAVRWDARCDLYARYGAPSEVRFQPVEADENAPGPETHTAVDALGIVRELGMPLRFPMRSMYWSRPDIGIHAVLVDMTLLGAWQQPMFAPDVRPDARAMARGDLLAASGGQALFRTIAPGLRSLAVAGTVHAFPGEPSPRLFAYVMAPGTPADSLVGECVVLDAAGAEVHRASRRLGASACDPTALRTAEFGFDVAPGAYRVAIAVRDGRDGRGVLRRSEHIAAPAGPLRMSDVVVVCRAPSTPPQPGALALDPDPLARGAAGEPLSVYYEIHGLTLGGDGLAQYEVTYSARPLKPRERRGSGGGRTSMSLDVRSEDAHAGSVRRQFVDLPVAQLADGDWNLEVRVRDRRTGAVAVGTARFRMGETRASP